MWGLVMASEQQPKGQECRGPARTRVSGGWCPGRGCWPPRRGRGWGEREVRVGQVGICVRWQGTHMHTQHTTTLTRTQHLTLTALLGSIFAVPILPSVERFEPQTQLGTSLPGNPHEAGVSLAWAPVPTPPCVLELQQRGAGRLGRSGPSCAVSAHSLTTPGTPVSRRRVAWTPSIWPGTTQETQRTAEARGW